MRKISCVIYCLWLSFMFGLACIGYALAGDEKAPSPAGPLLRQADSLALAGDSAATLALLDQADGARKRIGCVFELRETD